MTIVITNLLPYYIYLVYPTHLYNCPDYHPYPHSLLGSAVAFPCSETDASCSVATDVTAQRLVALVVTEDGADVFGQRQVGQCGDHVAHEAAEHVDVASVQHCPHSHHCHRLLLQFKLCNSHMLLLLLEHFPFFSFTS